MPICIVTATVAFLSSFGQLYKRPNYRFHDGITLKEIIFVALSSMIIEIQVTIQQRARSTIHCYEYSSVRVYSVNEPSIYVLVEDSSSKGLSLAILTSLTIPAVIHVVNSCFSFTEIMRFLNRTSSDLYSCMRHQSSSYPR